MIFLVVDRGAVDSRSMCRFEELINRADKALYPSKKDSRNKVVVYEGGDEKQVS